jgi:hypothetical protein
MNGRTKPSGPEIENEILNAIRKIRYGAVEIVIHDSRVVQIEVREKIRIDKGSNEGKASTE